MKKQIIITYEWTDSMGAKPGDNVQEQLAMVAEDNILSDIKMGLTHGNVQQSLFDKPYKGFWSIQRNTITGNEPTVESLVAQEVYKLKKEYDHLTLQLIDEYQKKIEETNEKGAKTDELLKSKQFALEEDFKRKETNLEKNYALKTAELLEKFTQKDNELNAGVVFATQKLQSEQAGLLDAYEKKRDADLIQARKVIQQKHAELMQVYEETKEAGNLQARISIQKEYNDMLEAFKQKYPEPEIAPKEPAQFFTLGAPLSFPGAVSVAHFPSDDLYHILMKAGEDILDVKMSGNSFKALLRNEPLTILSKEEIKNLFK